MQRHRRDDTGRGGGIAGTGPARVAVILPAHKQRTPTVRSGLGLVLRNLPSADIARIAAAAEDAGVRHLYLPETGLGAAPVTGRDPFITAAAALNATSQMLVGPGIAASTVRSARAAGLLAATLNEDSGGRFVLGVGVSHKGVIEALGLPFPTSPLRQLTGYVRELKALSADEGLTFGGGFPVVVGALGPKMVALGARESDGVVLNWLTPQSAGESCRTVAEQRPADPASTVLFVRTGPQENLRLDASTYHDNLPNYRNHFRSQGLHSVEDVTRGTCMPLDPGAIAERVGEYFASGVHVPCIYPTGMSVEEIVALLGKLRDHGVPTA